MTYLVDFFTWLMAWCHSWCPNVWLDIVLFTLLTKVLQFPVALWCQANSLKMVSLMPECNRIKMAHYGDSDAIGEETAKLFKREHYHPLLSLVPLAIQIVILMAFVKVIYGIGEAQQGSLIGHVPVTHGGWAWSMPLLAGAAAWLLGYAQNRINPLQREQTRLQQAITNGISIAISLFLGCFVAMGVGLYWATSNLLSILVQACENLCIRPARHVDYPALRRSQAELRRFEAELKAQTSRTPADKVRERADYKRFFKVANKHLVFYAEAGGYYKYFQSAIAWLLEHSNLTIHYITSSPKDPLLTAAPERLRVYYIGPTRLIPLMMKMDADMLVTTTPDLDTFHLKRSYVRKDIDYVYIDHGPTSMHMCYRKGAFDHFDTIMANGPFQVAEHRATEQLYALKPKRLIPSGYPLLDTLERLPPPVPPRPDENLRVMIANSHQPDNLFDLCLDDLLAALRAPGRRIILRPHPQYVRRNPAKISALAERFRNAPDIELECDFARPSTMDQAHLLVTDWSGIAYEYAYKTRRPTLFIDTPMKVLNPEWKRLGITPTDLSFRNEVGHSLSPQEIPIQAADIAADMLAHPDRFAARIDALFATQFFNPGAAGPAVGNAILDALIARKYA